MRIIACAEVGLDVSVDVQRLREMQDIDGGWKDGWFFTYPTEGLSVANDGLTTALAIKALQLSSKQ